MSKLLLGRRKKTRRRPRRQPDRAASLFSGLQRFVRSAVGTGSPAWLACIPLAIAIVGFWSLSASAQEEPLTPEDVKGILDAIWIVVAAVLVIFMNAGFGMLETGFCRQKNAVNILSKNLIVFALATLSFWAIGFGFMFGSAGTGFVGTTGFFSSLGLDTYETFGLDEFPAGLPPAVFFLFQAAFAGTAATIVSGAVAERIKFDAFIIFSILLVAISYPITGHWVWSGNAWLGGVGPGFGDFAGSTVVHSVGGWAALMGASFLGPRMGKYEGGEPRAIPGHNMSIATLGCLILWIGWFGFNPGSELAASPAVPFIAVTTNLAAAAGGVSATVTSWLTAGKPDLSMIINGILAGLVGITAGCASVDVYGAVIIGLVAGVIVVFSVGFFDSVLKVDDPVGAISVHLVNGIWGTLAVGLFATETGLFYGGGLGQLGVQILGILSIGGFTVVASSIFWILLDKTIGIRVTDEEENMGLDVGEHGMEAYSGFLKDNTLFAGGSVSDRPSGVPGTSTSPQ